MKKRMIIVLAGFVMASRWVAADLIYSNNFSGTEFKVDGVAAGVLGNMVESDGRLVPTASNANTVGFRVDLSGLGLAADPNVTAVRLSVSGKAPLTADSPGYLGIAFQNTGNFNVNSWGVPVVAIAGNGAFRAAGGVGFTTTANQLDNVAQGDNFTSGGEFTMDLIYHKNGTIDTWYNGVQIHSNQAIVSSETPALSHAVISFRNLGLDGANIDTFTVTVIPEPATLGLFTISALSVLLARRVFADRG